MFPLFGMNQGISHKVAGVKEAVESVGTKVVYLPPYSPGFNPIENVFSKLKTMLRKVKLRMVDELWKKLGKLCDIFASEECQNDFKHAAYYGNTKLQTNALAGVPQLFDFLRRFHRTKFRSAHRTETFIAVSRSPRLFVVFLCTFRIKC